VSLYRRGGKRVLDVALTLLLAPIALPVILVAAAAIKLDSPGPVFHRAIRVGRGGRKFTFLKLRSMQVGAEELRGLLLHLNQAEGPAFKLHNDPRVTRVGRLIRKASLDELPQLWHVLVGEYEPWMLRRLSVRPGLTCLWQIRGRSDLSFDEWMRLDIEYVERYSLPLDIKILVLTIPAVLSARGAY